MSDKPIVSVIMPTTKAREGFARLAVEWFAAQTWESRAELIVIEDQDDEPITFLDGDFDLRERLEAIGYDMKLAPSIRRCVSTGSSRPTIGRKLNEAIEMAQADIIMVWSDDDYFGPHRIEHQVQPILDGHALATMVKPSWLWVAGECRTYEINRSLAMVPEDGTLCFHRSLLRAGVKFADTNLPVMIAFIIDALRLTQCPIVTIENAWDFMYVRHPQACWQIDPNRIATVGAMVESELTAAGYRYDALVASKVTEALFEDGNTHDSLEQIVPDRLDLAEATK